MPLVAKEKWKEETLIEHVLFSRFCLWWHAMKFSTFQLYNTEAPLWVWQLGLKTVTTT